jgi:invasion protein IalB
MWRKVAYSLPPDDYLRLNCRHSAYLSRPWAQTRWGLEAGLKIGLMRWAMLGVAFLIGVSDAAVAADGLPGGATSLNEAHGDWTLNCASVAPSDGSTASVIRCSVSQTQFDKTSKQRVFVVGFVPQPRDGVKGNVVLPLGLDLSKGATFQIDQGATTSPIPFQTCLPAGCLVPLTWPGDTVKGLRSASNLKVVAVLANGQQAAFSVSMNGFAGALDRAIALGGTP